ncbi:MAG: tetraacyldisaccharide 4'-kinase [Rhodospirillum sp.]|nr:tetraacyldisaccharide 4'-kinase [Rhodospirillum sp.]MCF8488977.1 tetraacyldisaccharide 4'-kinase [Rhodospirillum sp.]MCF8500018.1 tetraacyldisaccharide 4'-kinase [Rhodospirillum sp.]
MKAPDFWHTDAFPARLLEPVGLLYGMATRRRLARGGAGLRLPIPVIRVGNLTAGGAGKTPVAMAVMEILLSRSVSAHFLSRGHGGTLQGPVQVDPDLHGAEDVGDEPLLLAKMAPCWIARDRAAGARAAVGAGAQALVMDDGHQNPALAVDLSLVVVDGGYGFGNRRLIPAGPLREPIAPGLRRADAVVILGEDTADIARWIPKGKPALAAHLEPGPEAANLVGRRVVAFAGIGRPGKFFATLRQIGARVVAQHPFADHYPYAETDIQPILDEAYDLGALPVTTAKDAVRLPADQRPQVDVLGVRAAFEAPDLFAELIADHLAPKALPAPG